MPFPNEHSARIVNPGKFESFARQNDELGQGIDVIFGIRKDGKSEIQAIRFDKDRFTLEEARDWLKRHDFKIIELEEAEIKRGTESKHPDNDKQSGHLDDEKKKQSGHDDEPSGGPGLHSHPHENGAGVHNHEGLPSGTGGHSHGEPKIDGLHRHRPGDPLEGSHAHEDGDSGEHRHPKALARTAEAEEVQWMPTFEAGGSPQPDYVISGKGAKGLFSGLFRLEESVSEKDGIPYFIDDYAVRWIPEDHVDPATGEVNVGASCWRGGL